MEAAARDYGPSVGIEKCPEGWRVTFDQITETFKTKNAALADALAWRACMALCRLSAHMVAPDWRIYQGNGRGASRHPPMPFSHRDNRSEPDGCPFCGWHVYPGAHWLPGPGKLHHMVSRHACCTAVYLELIGQVPCHTIAARQDWVCPETGEPLRYKPEGVDTWYQRPMELDHTTPLWKVRHEWDKHPWPDCLRFWGLGNLQALSSPGHAMKTRREARERAELRRGDGAVPRATAPALPLFLG